MCLEPQVRLPGRQPLGLLAHNPMIPVWMDGALKKALSISPELRYESFSEFLYDLEHPNSAFLEKSYVPLSQRNPLKFWQGLSAFLALVQVFTLWLWLG